MSDYYIYDFVTGLDSWDETRTSAEKYKNLLQSFLGYAGNAKYL